MNLFYQLLNALIGACLASHACLIYDRFEKQRTLFSYSHCDNCQTNLSLLEQIPIISFLCLKEFCHSQIPRQLLLFETLAGLLFFKIDCLSYEEWPLIIFSFFFLLCAIFDYHDQSFPTLFLFPLGIVSLFLYRFDNGWLFCLPVVILLSYYVYQNKIGSGDLFIYIFLIGIYGSLAANLIFLIASLSILLAFLFNRRPALGIPFLPYIFWGMCIYLYLK